MIVDTSAIMAILLQETDAERFLIALFEDSDSKLSAGTWIELSAVITRRRQPHLASALQALTQHTQIRLVPVSIRQAQIGHAAYRAYGRGSGHRARLNLGDCFAYALASESGEPLLYKGDDFVHTDIVRAV